MGYQNLPSTVENQRRSPGSTRTGTMPPGAADTATTRHGDSLLCQAPCHFTRATMRQRQVPTVGGVHRQCQRPPPAGSARSVVPSKSRRKGSSQ